MKPLTRIAALVFTAAAVLVATPGCERRPASTTKMFVDEAYEKTNAAAKEHGDKKGHGDKKKDAHPPAAAPGAPEKFVPGK